MRKIINVIVKIFFLIFNKAFNFLKIVKDIFYSSWVKNYFNSCGSNFNIKSATIKGGNYMHIGNNFTGIYGLRFECWDSFNEDKFKPQLNIGNCVSMNNNIHIGCIDKITIGNNVLLASNIFITDHFHGYVDERDLGIPPHLRPLNSKGPVIIEDNVWIGENVTIMPNVTIGSGCIIGANSVVTRSFGSNSVLGGVPAKLIRNLND